MSTRSFLRGAFWALIALLILIHAAAGWYFSGELIEDGFVPDPEPMVDPGGDIELTEVSYSSPLGQMDAWHMPAEGSTWVIHVHGKGSTPAQMDYLFQPIQEAGYPQLAITYRNDDGQPADPSGFYQYGTTEWEDIKGAVDYAEANGARAVVFNGFSTGASHVLAFVYRFNLDDVHGVMLDAPNMDMGATVDYGASQRELPLLPMNVPPTITWVAKFITSLRIGVNWKSIDYVDKAESSLRTPVLIHHTTDDPTVPVTQSVDLVEARPELVRLIQVDGEEHHGSYDADPDQYVADVLAFLQEVS